MRDRTELVVSIAAEIYRKERTCPTSELSSGASGPTFEDCVRQAENIVDGLEKLDGHAPAGVAP